MMEKEAKESGRDDRQIKKKQPKQRGDKDPFQTPCDQCAS